MNIVQLLVSVLIAIYCKQEEASLIDDEQLIDLWVYHWESMSLGVILLLFFFSRIIVSRLLPVPTSQILSYFSGATYGFHLMD